MGKDTEEWLDEVLDKSQKQEIADKIKFALDAIGMLKVDEAERALKELHEELEGGEPIHKYGFSHNFGHVHDGNGSHGTINGTHTYTYDIHGILYRLREDLNDIKREMHDLVYVFRSEMQGRRLNDMTDYHRVLAMNEAASPVMSPPRVHQFNEDLKELMKELHDD